MSSDKLKKIPTNRLPAPALFVGPPSHNASNTSLLAPPSDAGKQSRTPLARQRSLLSQDPKRPLPPASARSDYDGDRLTVTSSNLSAPFHSQQKRTTEAAEAEAAGRAEAIWAQMQNTLEEVELSDIKGPGMTVFGSEHSRALDDLRRAQIDLAKAWARSEAEESGEVAEERKSAQGTDATNMLASERADTVRSGSAAAGSGVGTFERSRLEEETEKDIELSRKRREANDRYFEKVNKGVLEVVMKLEEVAKAMKNVEQESKEIWHDGESVDDVETASSLSSVT
ncbi:uncharacterized protein EI97DRAFT_384116 [Westerdykella ornata]|uniref:Uncharacterized protein n=1 Tax=Westerdykella ornata TaxID=318751 RepID=A0A6A6JC89_WESOR|nr:uncharacterized protein EI97DRAFT_384116 [Westerdykella ornata]KAF2273246.1 hypothetical protein EI97DRAFT_384116 [Westerdykella ornata]